MDLTPAALFVALVSSAIGMGLLVYGRKQRRWPQSVAGMALIGIPFLGWSAWALAGASAGVVALLWWGVRLGL